MRAHKPKGGANDPVKRIQDRDYVYFMPLVEPASSKAIAEGPILSYQYCLSDSLLVTYYSVFRLKQLDTQLVEIYLLCFIHHRYQRLHDNLLNSLIHDVRRYGDEAKAAAKERVYRYHVEHNQDLHKAGQVLKLFIDEEIDANTPFQAVQAQAFTILERPQLARIADQITSDARFDETAFQWDHIDSLAHQFKRHLRPILLAVDFAASQVHTPLLAAVQFLQAAFRTEKPLSQYAASQFPIRCIPPHLNRYLYATDVQGRSGRIVIEIRIKEPNLAPDGLILSRWFRVQDG